MVDSTATAPSTAASRDPSRKRLGLPRPARLGSPRFALAGALVASLVFQLLFVRSSWFFLDDIRNIAEARNRGLSLSFLTSPIGERFTPGHRFLDWLVAVPLGGTWGAAVMVLLALTAVTLAYLAASLNLLFGARRRNAIPVLLAGTAWPLLGTGQWFAGAALAIPVVASFSGAMFHFLRWRVASRRGDWAAALAWTVVGLLFSQQAILIPAVLVLCGLVLQAGIPSRRSLGGEIVAALPFALPALILQAYVGAQSYTAPVKLPSVTQFLDLLRVIVVRSLLPSSIGIGMDGAPPDPSREVLMRGLAAAAWVVFLLLAIWLSRRWLAAVILCACGVIFTAGPIAVARLDVGVSVAGSEVRYALPGVLLGALAVGALLAPQTGRARRGRGVPTAALPAALALCVIWAGVYIANAQYTYRARTVALGFAGASRTVAQRLERGLRQLTPDRASEVIDGPLPYPLFYPSSGNLRFRYGKFFLSRGVVPSGVPGPHGQLLTIAADGSLQAVAFHPAGPMTTCTAVVPCQFRLDRASPPNLQPVLQIELRDPAQTTRPMTYTISGATGQSTAEQVELPIGTTRFVVPVEVVDPNSIAISDGHAALALRAAQAGWAAPA